MFRLRKKDQLSRRHDVRKILVEQLENRKLMAADVMPSIMGSSYFGFAVSSDDSAQVAESFRVDVNNLPASSFGGVAIARSSIAHGAIPTSFALDLNNLPEGTVVGEAIAVSDAVPGDVSFVPAVDLNSVMRSSAVDLNNLPEDSMFGKPLLWLVKVKCTPST